MRYYVSLLLFAIVCTAYQPPETVDLKIVVTNVYNGDTGPVKTDDSGPVITVINGPLFNTIISV